MREFFKRTVKDRIDANRGLKFMVAATGAIALVMILGTVFVTRMVLAYQYRTVEVRGRETGTVLGKAIIDRLVASDQVGLNMLVEDVVKSPEILSVVIANTDGRPLTSARSVSIEGTRPSPRSSMRRKRTMSMRSPKPFAGSSAPSKCPLTSCSKERTWAR